MKISNQYQTTNFCSVHKADAIILKKIQGQNLKKYTPEKVSIVEFISTDAADQSTIQKTVNYWNSNNNAASYFANGILRNFSNDVFEKCKTVKQRFFGVEIDDKTKDEYENILCLVQFDESAFKYDKIKWLQVNPKYVYQNDKNNREYNGIGTQIVKFLKSISKKPIEVFSAGDSVDFYKKTGFKQHIFCKDIITYFTYND